MAVRKQKGTVSIDAQNIMPVIKRWLYSDKDIFLREAVSNACDAITKYRMLHPETGEELKVFVTVDRENKTIRISDTGIGMTADEVKKYINQVAFSGATEFMKQFEDSKEEDKGDIIGHFGLGFYSVFMVSELVEIETLSHEEGADPVHWTSEDGMSFEMSAGKRTEHGTDIILHISEDEKEFLEIYRVREVLNRYCGYMSYPVMLEDANAKPVEKEVPVGDEKNEDGTPKTEKVMELPKPSQINDTDPLWLKKPSECTDDQYKEFYRKVFMDYDDPLFWIHLNVDYPFNLKGILFFPKLKNDFGTHEGQIKLFAGQVFVADNIKEVIPEYLLLLKGCIDCPDLPLNVSRSFLQNDGTVIKLQSHIVKKVSDKLTGLFNTERENYEKYWDDIAPFIKFGCVRDENFFEKVEKALLFKTCEGKYKTVEEYLEDCKTEGEGDKAKKLVYYTSDPAGQSAYIDLFKANGIDPVVLDHVIDNAFISFMEYKKQNITFKRADADVSGVAGDTVDDEALAALIKPIDDKIEVKSSDMKEEGPPALILISEEERRMREMMKQWGNSSMAMPDEKKTFMFNSSHPLVKKLSAMEEGEDRDLIAAELYDSGCVGLHSPDDELSRFIERTARLMEKL